MKTAVIAVAAAIGSFLIILALGILSFHSILDLWFVLGLMVALMVRAQTGRLDAHRDVQSVFWAAVVLAGPLFILLAFVPRTTLRRHSQALRAWLDARKVVQERSHND
jgi:hypothetical protein